MTLVYFVVVSFTNVSLMQLGVTPLYYAAKNGHAEVVDLLLVFEADINKVCSSSVSMQCTTTSQANM